jgi:hypothetical protein
LALLNHLTLPVMRIVLLPCLLGRHVFTLRGPVPRLRRRVIELASAPVAEAKKKAALCGLSLSAPGPPGVG